jgi:Fe-S-cluster-containing dehydrogenase component/DMSO reductase anchor subunit
MTTTQDTFLKLPVSPHDPLPILDFNAQEGPSLISYLLQKQQELSAVDVFSREHSLDLIPAQSRYYEKLLPASPPGPGQQYAFEVDLDRCSGCKACVTGCHAMNGLDDDETWRDVGLLIGGTSSNPIMQHVTTACHHCIEPACMIACPVDAYEKDPTTGIVKHLDDQCFGCQYCTLACPYDVPKYHHAKGVVRKCDMCSDRLKTGEAPACVQSCPHEAISIRLVDVKSVIENSEVDHFLPGAPEPHQTMPTTTYKTKRVFPRNTLPADYYSVSPQHPHLPLIATLIFNQMSVGAFIVGIVLEGLLQDAQISIFRPIHTLTALFIGMLALATGPLHLGRPMYAFRAIIGLRHSWLSREILMFGVFAGAAQSYAALSWMNIAPPFMVQGAGWSVAVTGLIGIFCSVMIYVFTKREFWSFGRTGYKFMMTAAVMGVAGTWFSLVVIGLTSQSSEVLTLISKFAPVLNKSLIVFSLLKMGFEASLFLHLTSRRVTTLKRSAMLMTRELAPVTIMRFVCGLIGGVLIPAMMLSEFDPTQISTSFLVVLVTTLFVLNLVGEFLERYLFFSAVAAPRMPGSIRP